MLSNKALLIFFIIFTAIAGAMYVWNLKSPPKDAPPLIDQGNWQQTEFQDLGISLYLPPEFEVSQNGAYSRIFAKKAAPQGAGNPSFIYISVVPAGMEQSEGEIYNYNPTDFQTLISMQVGEEKVLGGSIDANLNQYFKYRRIEDVMLGRYGTKSYINTKPWEFPGGTTEYRLITEFTNVKYVIGGYLGLDVSSPSYISREEFNRILDTVKFSPDGVKPANPATTSSEWNTFTDEVSQISFKYPKNWQVGLDTQIFKEGDLFHIYYVGKTQREGTEFYDGALFAVMQPVTSNFLAEEWLEQRYANEIHTEQDPVFSEETIGGKTFQKAYICGLGCISYYHIKENGKIYGIGWKSDGPEKEYHESVFKQIMLSLNFNPS